MRFNLYFRVTGLAAVALISGGQAFAAARSSSSQDVPLATPPGITIQETRVAGAMGGYNRGPAIPAFADANGMTVYTYEKDVPGKIACVDACLQKWRPAMAPPKSSASGQWTLVARGEGKQWALNGKPLYTFAEDTKLGEVKGKGQEDGAWQVAAPDPTTGVATPVGIDVQDVADANGLTLTDADKMTLYTYDGDLKREKNGCFEGTACTSKWHPVVAPKLAQTVGEFTVVNRRDGIKQWMFKGKPLYTFEGDIEPFDANGIGVDKRIQPAVVARYFAPEGVQPVRTAGQGVVWANAQGLTVYRRSIYTFQQGGHGLRRGVPISPAMGRGIGAPCDENCQKTWRPLVAAPDAVSSGYWEILTAADGTRQWTYKGYALFANVNDKKVGDLAGHDVFDLSFEEKNARQVADAGVAKSDAPAAPPKLMSPYYWSYAYP